MPIKSMIKVTDIKVDEIPGVEKEEEKQFNKSENQEAVFLKSNTYVCRM
jgi:hypothetical protein